MIGRLLGHRRIETTATATPEGRTADSGDRRTQGGGPVYCDHVSRRGSQRGGLSRAGMFPARQYAIGVSGCTMEMNKTKVHRHWVK